MRSAGDGQAAATGVVLDFEGRPIPGHIGETIAAALTAAGIRGLRITPEGDERGLFCGMGVCHECLLEVDGRAGMRACMTSIGGPHRLRRQPALTTLTVKAAAPIPDDRPTEEAEVVVVGGGPGGLSAAAAAAAAGADVILIDERPQLGGQYFKQPTTTDSRGRGADARFRQGAALIERVRRAGARVINGTVWGAFAEREIAVAAAEGARRLRPRKLIIATGAYERPAPVPGWTLPGVMTTGAAQTLLRGSGVLPGRRLLLAGNGPLNLQVAYELARAGAEIAAVAELSAAIHAARLPVLLAMLQSAPGLVRDGAAYLFALRRRGVPILYGHRLAGVAKTNGGLRASLQAWDGRSFGHEKSFDVDAVLMGLGFLPSNELLRALGARQAYDPRRAQLTTLRSETCETSVPGVYAVGDCCGLGGAQAAMAEGLIAGAAAASSLGRLLPRKLAAEVRGARARLSRHRRFQAALWTLFAPVSLPPAPAREVVACRCEGVRFGAIEDVLADGLPSIGEIKRLTRLGMGRCQGRYCGPVIAAMIAEHRGCAIEEEMFPAPRSPAKPVRLADLIR